MTTHVSVTQWAADLRSDDTSVRNRAAQLIWERDFSRLLERARDNLDRRGRRGADEEDVLQSMYKSFCERQKRGEYDLANRDALLKLLVTITLHKAWNANRDEGRQKRNVALIVESDRWALEQMEATEPSPAEAAIFNETLERWREVLADPDLVQIALLRLERYTIPEIAGHARRHARTDMPGQALHHACQDRTCQYRHCRTCQDDMPGIAERARTCQETCQDIAGHGDLMDKECAGSCQGKGVSKRIAGGLILTGVLIVRTVCGSSRRSCHDNRSQRIGRCLRHSLVPLRDTLCPTRVLAR